MEVQRETPNPVCRGIARLGGLPRLMATVATLVAVGLAVAPGGSYNAQLAVLTATLVAVIWYAYFTFRAVRPKARVVVKSGAKVTPDLFRLSPEVENPNDRKLYIRIFLNVWIDGEPVQLTPFYNGERWVPRDPGRAIQGRVSLTHRVNVETSSRGRRFIGNEVALISMRAEWIDDLCERGTSSTLYWKVQFSGYDISPVLDPERIETLFADLPAVED